MYQIYHLGRGGELGIERELERKRERERNTSSVSVCVDLIIGCLILFLEALSVHQGTQHRSAIAQAVHMQIVYPDIPGFSPF